MRVKSHHKGHIISVRFYDHCIGGDAELIECEIIGRVMSVSPRDVIIEHWSIYSEDQGVCEQNRERVAIAQATIISIIEYSPKKGKRFY